MGNVELERMVEISFTGQYTKTNAEKAQTNAMTMQAMSESNCFFQIRKNAGMPIKRNTG